jgi:hypothetical protein
MKSLTIFLFSLFLGLSANAKEIKLTADNTAVLRSDFNSQSVRDLKNDLLELNAQLKSGYPIYLFYTLLGEKSKKD